MTGSIIAVLMTAGIVIGQPTSNDQVKVRTVCEILGDVSSYADSVVAIVGRWERSVSIIDHYEFLSQDRCKHPLVTNGHVWPNKIQIWMAWEEGMPKPPAEKPNFATSVVTQRLLIVQRTTGVGYHQEPNFKANGPSTVEVPNKWAIVYGRIVRAPNLNEDCGVEGCGGDGVPLFILAEPYNVHGLQNDGTPLTKQR